MKRSTRLLLPAALALLLGMCSTRPGRAQVSDSLGGDAPVQSPPATAGTEQAVIGRYWELGRTRPFVAANVELGVMYLRPKFSAGYGRPYWSWVGVEGYPVVGLGGIGYYSGVAFTIPGLILRAGGRYFYPYKHRLLEPREHFSHTRIDLVSGPAGDYVAYEAEAAGTAPLGPGGVFGVLTGIRTGLVPEGYYLYEDSLRVVMKPPYVWRARAGYLLALGRKGALRVGAAAEVIGLPGRDEFVIRGGLMTSVLLSAKLEVQASLIPVLKSPDSLGLAGSDFGQLGIRYRWTLDSTPDPERVRQAVERARLAEPPP